MGKLNILQHKSWHVYSRDNVEKVRKDEENHRLAEEEKATRAAIAEAEARMSQLRSHARQRYGSEIKEEGGSMGEAPKGPDGHVNFFYDVEKAREAQAIEEKEKEKKQEQQQWEKKVGILTYLGQSASEATGQKQFYEAMATTTILADEKVIDPKETKRKERHDPLAVMDKYLAVKAGKPPSPKEKSKKEDREPKNEKKKKKDKKKDKDPKAERLHKLREERLARERQEQLRARQMMTQTRMQPEPQQTDQGYSSQFNPQLARQNRARDQRHRPY